MNTEITSTFVIITRYDAVNDVSLLICTNHKTKNHEFTFLMNVLTNNYTFKSK